MGPDTAGAENPRAMINHLGDDIDACTLREGELDEELGA